jgi:glycosyltransferase involved in cell wall biosynthesis
MATVLQDHARIFLDPDISLSVPLEDAHDPELSIVIPAMNEQITIADFVDWCKQGLRDAGINGEILIVDSSTDMTPEIALAHGARVLRTPKRGLGRAYIDAIPFIRAPYILMGDADCTYDFRQISGFVERFREGYEFIMGSRLKGYIEPRAMPALHRYFGTPLTTRILNFLYSTHFSDIHCGMRGITRNALIRIELESQSWQYASEMVLKSVCIGLRIAETPVRFLRDREGRSSHLKRSGWFEPWRAGWINLEAMFVYGADFFVLRPGIVLLIIGLLITLPLSFGPVKLGPITLSLYSSLVGVALSIVGLQSFYLGCVAQVIYNYSPISRQKWLRLFAYTRTVILAVLMGVTGVCLTIPLMVRYVRGGFLLNDLGGRAGHAAVTGLLLLIFGFMTFTFTLVLHAAALRARKRATSLPSSL